MGSRAVFYGLGETATVRAENVHEAGEEGMTFTVVAGGERAEAKLALLGRHNVYNALAGIAAGLQCGMTLAECVEGLRELQPSDKRGEVLHWHGATLINDCYNSNPRALDAMVEALLAVKARRHIVIAGEMLELGPEGPALHEASGRTMAQLGIRHVIGVRGLAEHLAAGAKSEGAEAIFVATPEEAGQWLQANLRAGDAVLLKASRGVRLERALAGIH
jgi:UDP-N-acetylmuramoyl-tripeptide--D-alanyl-D-alanine ligase